MTSPEENLFCSPCGRVHRRPAAPAIRDGETRVSDARVPAQGLAGERGSQLLPSWGLVNGKLWGWSFAPLVQVSHKRRGVEDIRLRFGGRMPRPAPCSWLSEAACLKELIRPNKTNIPQNKYSKMKIPVCSVVSNKCELRSISWLCCVILESGVMFNFPVLQSSGFTFLLPSGCSVALLPDISMHFCAVLLLPCLFSFAIVNISLCMFILSPALTDKSLILLK